MGLINIILISIISHLMFVFASAEMTSDTVAVKIEIHSEEIITAKEKAFTILTTKCNSCHKTNSYSY